jgi:hypothetical protein
MAKFTALQRRISNLRCVFLLLFLQNNKINILIKYCCEMLYLHEKLYYNNYTVNYSEELITMDLPLKGKMINVSKDQSDSFLKSILGDVTVDMYTGWEYTLESDIVEHSTLLGFVLNAPMGRKIAVTAEDIFGLKQQGFKIACTFVTEKGIFCVPHTKKPVSVKDVENMAVYMSIPLKDNIKKVEDWAKNQK